MFVDLVRGIVARVDRDGARRLLVEFPYEFGAEFRFELADDGRRTVLAFGFGVATFVAQIEVAFAVEPEPGGRAWRRRNARQALVLRGIGVDIDHARLVDVQMPGGVDSQALDFSKFFGFFGFFALFHGFFVLADQKHFLAFRSELVGPFARFFFLYFVLVEPTT